MSEIYEPGEDSFLLSKHVRLHARGKVLDMGTGSGILAESAAASPRVGDVLAVDKNKDAIEECRKKIQSPLIKFKVSDLFSGTKSKFDTIIFNPPYLPKGKENADPALIGGRKGHEVIEKFLKDVKDYMKPEGHILLLFSSHTKKMTVDRLIISNLLLAEELERKNLFYEELYVYRITKNNALDALKSKGVSDIELFSGGKRGLIYTGMRKNTKVAIKVDNPASKAIARMENEGNWMQKLNRVSIGPKYISSGADYVLYEFVEGSFIEQFLKEKAKKSIITVIKRLFRQMFEMDRIQVDKEEMHHPWKHVIISGLNPVLLDFERCNVSISPKNVTQFCQFITSKRVSKLLSSKKIMISKYNMIRAAENYKSMPTKKNFEEILDEP